VVGRHCEAGDVIAGNVALPRTSTPATCSPCSCTGAYHHSMGSQLQPGGAPTVVAVHRGKPLRAHRRETDADLLGRDLDE